MVLEPVVELRKSLADLSSTLLLYQSKLTNAYADDEIAHEIKKHSANIMSKSSVVFGYSIARFFFKIPSKENILEASGLLNLIYYNMTPGVQESHNSNPNTKKRDHAVENWEHMKEISKLLNITTTYENIS